MEKVMENTKVLNHNFATIGWGALLVWWGISFMVWPITLGMSAVSNSMILPG
jgi:hypothetical protein